METVQMSKTMEYLTDAAHLLHETAPGTAAHLMAQRRDLLYEHKLSPHETQRQHICGACGDIMTPGTGSTTRIQSSRCGRKKSQPPKGSIKSMSKTITCGRCDAKTRIDLAGSVAPVRCKKTRKPRSTMTKGQVETSTSAGPGQPKLSSNAGSKKRAKNRKAGLQALLSGQRQQQSNPLSLASFMKK